MKAPGEKQIIQIIVSSYCDLACSNCTQLIPQQGKRYHMGLDNFRRAVESLADWPGIIGVFGGNPCTHPRFADICRTFTEIIPEKSRRGLWSNRIFGHGDIIRETFGYLNLVVHNDHEAAEEMRAAGIGPVHGDGRPAWHSPILVSLRDAIPSAAERAELIEDCDINKYWSGAIDQAPDGSLRAWHCEVASSMARAYGAGGGVAVTPGWWRKGMDAWQHDVRDWCNRCGVPLRMKGQLDIDGTDDYTRDHAALVQIRPARASVLHADIDGTERARVVTDYLRLRT